MGTETADYYARLDEADAAVSAGDVAAELVACKRALYAAEKLSNITQQSGNSINWSNARDILERRITRLDQAVAVSAAVGVQRSKTKYIRPTECT